MSKDLRFAMLLDCYGEFLTPHQYRLTELYERLSELCVETLSETLEQLEDAFRCR